MGGCKSFLKRFYFDSKTGNCRPFIYSGCQGNHNNFVNINDCVQACVSTPDPGYQTPDVNLFQGKKQLLTAFEFSRQIFFAPRQQFHYCMNFGFTYKVFKKSLWEIQI